MLDIKLIRENLAGYLIGIAITLLFVINTVTFFGYLGYVKLYFIFEPIIDSKLVEFGILSCFILGIFIWIGSAIKSNTDEKFSNELVKKKRTFGFILLFSSIIFFILSFIGLVIFALGAMGGPTTNTSPFYWRVLPGFTANLVYMQFLVLVVVVLLTFVAKKYYLKTILLLTILSFMLAVTNWSAKVLFNYDYGALQTAKAIENLEGLTIDSCQKGVPSVPWGKYYYSKIDPNSVQPRYSYEADAYSVYSVQDQCFYELARGNLDSSICEKISNDDFEFQCYGTVVYELGAISDTKNFNYKKSILEDEIYYPSLEYTFVAPESIEGWTAQGEPKSIYWNNQQLFLSYKNKFLVFFRTIEIPKDAVYLSFDYKFISSTPSSLIQVAIKKGGQDLTTLMPIDEKSYKANDSFNQYLFAINEYAGQKIDLVFLLRDKSCLTSNCIIENPFLMTINNIRILSNNRRK